MFLPHLRHLAVTDISPDWLHSLALFCPRLSSLTVAQSELSDEALSHLTSLHSLHKIKFTQVIKQTLHVPPIPQVSSITPFGYAELLRGLPELRSLGRCDCFGEVRHFRTKQDDHDMSPT